MGKPIKILSNSSQLLNLLADQGQLGIPELSERLDMPRASVYRLVDALTHVGLVGQSEDGKFSLGLEVLHLASAALRALPEIEVARPELEYLNEATGQTIYLCALRGTATVCLDWVPGSRVSLLLLGPGGTLPPHAGATSRVFLAFDDDLRRDVIRRPLERITDKTLTEPSELDADAQAIRSAGFSVSDEDVTVGIAALGVPVHDRAGNVTWALSVAGLRAEILDSQEEFVNLLKEAGARMSRRLS
ncbi:IclR family transcriptional regulator (plasmid) [Arthrobacter sp. UC242_113]|uniref:IclR family transcriptional regulator n=1 Tax=Arthrobacter sp. UC242_113 TaxID=3374550 RepID=UPI003758053B